MFPIPEFLAGLLLCVIVYWWINLKRHDRKLKWVPQVSGNPIIGNVLDFGSSTDTLNVLSGYLEQRNNGLCLVDLIVKKLVVISDIKLLEFLLTTTKILNKSAEYRFLGRWLGNGLLTADGPRWKKSRKIITPAFHFSILGDFISIFEANAEIMIKLLDKEIGKDSVDICPFVTMCTLDIICETSMGVSVNAQLDRQSDYVLAVKEMTRIIVDRSFSAFKQLNIFYPLTKDFYKELKCVKTLHSYTDSVIRSRKEELTCGARENKNLQNEKTQKSGLEEEYLNTNRKKLAFLDLLLEATLDGKPLPHWYIREEVSTLMFEGHDTTSSAISFALFCLAENPEVQVQVIEEQRRIFQEAKNRPITYQDIQDMKYLELVIKETLRIYPSVPFYARSTDTDIEYKDGQIIPKGTTLILFAYGLHKNPVFFPNPEKFDPSRFEKTTRMSPFTYLPFSAGPRNCIGQKFAMQEMKVVISKILRNYEILPSIPKHNPILAAETVLKSSNGVKIRIKARNLF